MQLRGVVYHQIILNANFELFLFLRKSKTAFYFKVRFCYMQDCSFDSLLQGLFAKPFFLGDEYIVYYIQGLTSPTTAAREGTIVYLRVIIIWEFLQMLNFQYKKSDLLG